jgi:hypothetical protein
MRKIDNTLKPFFGFYARLYGDDRVFFFDRALEKAGNVSNPAFLMLLLEHYLGEEFKPTSPMMKGGA